MASKSTSTPAAKSNVRSYKIDSFSGGISDWDDKGIKGAFKGGSSNINIRRQTDSIFCQQALVDETPPIGGFLDLILFIVNCSDGNAYGFGDAGHIYKRTSLGVWTNVYTDANGAILGAAEWYDIGGFASALITSNNTNVSNNDTVTVNGQVYTFVTTLTGAANQVLIGATADASLVNLASAINNVFSAQGVAYSTGTVKNASVVSGTENSANHTLTLTAITPGLGGNAITLAKSAATLTISGATFSGGTVSNTFLYWATATQLNRKIIPGDGVTPWDDVNGSGNGGDPWPKTTLTSAPWHTMAEAQGDLMICNDHYLAMVGYDDSFTEQAVDLIKGNQANTVIERGDYAIAGTKKTNGLQKAFYFSWQSQALDWINKGKIPSGGINAMIDTEVPLLQSGTQGDIFYSDFVNTLPATSFPGGGQVNPDGVDDDGGLALFGVYGNGNGNSGVYSYGRDNKNSPFILNLEYQLNCDKIGSVKLVGTDTLISYKNGATYGVKKVDQNNKAVATYISLDLKAPEKPPSIPTVWTKIKLKTAKLPVSCSITCYYRTDKQGSFQQAYMAGNVTTFNTTNATEAVFLISGVGEIFEVQLVLTPNGNNSAEVYKIVPFFI